MRCLRKVKKRSQDDFKVLCYLNDWESYFGSEEKVPENELHLTSGSKINNFGLRIRNLREAAAPLVTED